MRREDNTVFVLQKSIKQFKIKVNKESIKEELLSNPYYPSLKSVCDTLKKYNVEYYPLRLTIEEIKNLELPYMAHLKIGKGQLAFVKEIKNGKVTYFVLNNKPITGDFEDFARLLSGAVVLMQAKKKSGEKGYKTKGQLDTIDFLFNWYSTSGAERRIFYEKDLPDGFDIAGQIKKKNKQLFEEYKVPGTPTIFVNGYKMPGQYELNDIECFLDDIKNLTLENISAISGKRQEANAKKSRFLPATSLNKERR